MQTPYKCETITQEFPRISVVMSWGSAPPTGEFRLYMRRLGEQDEFAYYPAIEVKGGEIVFQFDNLLFDKGIGRYEGRLVVDTVEYARVHINYKASNTLVAVENPNV